MNKAEKELRQLFKNNSDCYADSCIVIQAMTEDKFIEVFQERMKEEFILFAEHLESEGLVDLTLGEINEYIKTRNSEQ